MNFMPPKRPRKTREPLARAELEHMLAEAVRYDSQCKAFVGVVIRPVIPARSGDVNWAVRGVKYGNADRDRCAAALWRRVAEAQQLYELAPGPKTAEPALHSAMDRPASTLAPGTVSEWMASLLKKLKDPRARHAWSGSYPASSSLRRK